NCVAIGLAAGFMEPLESTSIHLVQSGISRLLTLFPDTAFDQSLAEEYNRQTTHEYERIRDFLILHYHANGRIGEAFWEERLSTDIPESLRQKMQLFRATGQIVREADELFTEQSWLQVLLGQDIPPRSCHAATGAMNTGQLTEFMSQTRRAVKRTVRNMPMHEEFLKRHCPAAKI
ncbi:MAG: tryptophan 7-halogenase, partial [Wenzhouxiangellaceae bacterium]|nr:tryptophan 7-halogenase [Wenzhouxiangellaceae bacterium]